MLGLSSIGTALKLAAGAAIVALVAGAGLYLWYLRSENASLTQANVNLQASVAVANQAAADSAKAAQAIQAAADNAQAAVAAEHQSVMAAGAAADSIEKEFQLAPLPDLACSAATGLPPAYMRALDEPYDAPAGGGAVGKDGQPQAAGGVPGAAAGMAAPAATH